MLNINVVSLDGTEIIFNKSINKYRFWFDDTHYGVSEGHTLDEAFQFFINYGFDYTDVVRIEIER